MTQTMQIKLLRYHSSRRRSTPLCLTAFLALLTSSSLHAQINCDANAVLAVGHGAALPGQIAVVELRGSSLCEVNGFAMAIGHPFTLEFIEAQPGPFLKDYPDLFFFSREFNDEGFATLFGGAQE